MNFSTKTTGVVLAAGALAVGSALATVPAAAVTKSYTAAQVATHRSASNCWTIIGSGVYNLTSYVKRHPGGAGNIVSLCGRNGTRAFRAMHGTGGDANWTLTQFKIGTLRK